jgi:NAD(P)-dependent dehydrogenase (short-subunit alcohol dehydrogenase family)
MFNLAGKNAVVVGGAGYLGSEISRVLAAQHARLIVSDLHEDVCLAVRDSLEDVSEGAHLVCAVDVSDEQGVAALAAYCSETVDRVDVLVFCVGLTSAVALDGYAVPFDQQNMASWKKAIAVNLDSSFLLAKAFHPLLKKSGDASVIFLSSIYGSLGANLRLYDGTGMNNPIAYGASKGGLEQVMRYLAVQWAPGIRVNCVSPGGIERGQNPDFIRRYEEMTPMQRMGRPDDISGPVVFLASDAARYITGQNLLVDGGWSAW